MNDVLKCSYEFLNFIFMISEDEIEYALTISGTTNSIDETINSEGKVITYHDIISDNSMNLYTLISIKSELQKLTPLEQEIISKRYLENLSQSEVANILGLTQVKVSREESKIKKRIKQN